MKKLFPTLFIACCLHLAINPAVHSQNLAEKVRVAQTQPAKINLNSATQTELASLPGIGPSKAQAILDYRAENGDFSNIQQLVKVKGIGNKLAARITPLVVVE